MIFVSHRHSDLDIVDDVLRVLEDEGRRYFVIRGRGKDALDGFGSTTQSNSKAAVQKAEAVLVLASVDYARQVRDLPNGNLAIEIGEMTHRRDQIPIAFLPVDGWETLKGLPLEQLTGSANPPYTGPPLKGARAEDLRSSVRAALKRIDEWTKQ